MSLTPKETARCVTIIDEFWEWTCRCYGHYREAAEAFPEYAKAKIALVELNKPSGDLRPEDYIISFPRLQRAGQKPVRHLHSVELPDLLSRNAFEGVNIKFVGRMAIVAIYSYWDAETRPQLNSILGGTVNAPLMGELRRIRNKIVHASARTSELATITLLKTFTEGEFVEVKERQLGMLVDEIAEFCAEFKSDPQKFVTELKTDEE